MHIMNCPVCGKRIPINSPQCPECNINLTEYSQDNNYSKPRFGKRSVLLIVILMVFLLIIDVGIYYMNNIANTSSESPIAEESRLSDSSPNTSTTPSTEPTLVPTDTSGPVGVYRGNDGNILVLNEDGFAYYYCSDIEYTELKCPWEYKDGRLNIQFYKMHCVAYSDIDKENFSEILLRADSQNWNDELLKRLNVSPDTYLDRKVESCNPSVTVNSDGSMFFVLDGVAFTVPKQYWTPPDSVELGENVVEFVDADIDSDYVSVLFFYKDDSPAEENFPSRFLNGVKTNNKSNIDVAGRNATTCDIKGTFNTGFPTLSGIPQTGTFTTIPNPDGESVLYVLMLQTENRDLDNSDSFTDILNNSY